MRQVFEQAICGLLRADGATVLMTTNATHLLSKLDQVWVMQEGSIVCSQPHALPIEPRTEDGAGDADVRGQHFSHEADVHRDSLTSSARRAASASAQPQPQRIVGAEG